MLFIPPGCVLLTEAVDRLAEARRLAGKTNDDGKHAAQAELRGEFYSDTISPLVVSRSGGEYKIKRHNWGNDELAPTWFEYGEFWLIAHEYLVDPPLPMFHEKELAHIFVTDHDLRRLMAKQEVKQEYSDQSPPVRLAKAKIESEFRRWREQQPSDYIPTEVDDTEHMKKFSVSRDTVRELRKGYPRRPRGQKK